MTCEAYIDSQFTKLQHTLYEAEIEEQTNAFNKLKASYDAYITEGDTSNTKFKFTHEVDIKKAIKTFFHNIVLFMERWIAKIIAKSAKYKSKIEPYFDDEKQDAPALDVMDCAVATGQAIQILRDAAKEQKNIAESIKEADDKILKGIVENMKNYKPTKFKTEIQQLTGYKNAIKSIKDFGNLLINYKNPNGNVLISAIYRYKFSFIKKIIKCVQARATFAAKLILATMKAANRNDPSIAEQDIIEMDKDIREARESLSNQLSDPDVAATVEI